MPAIAQQHSRIDDSTTSILKELNLQVAKLDSVVMEQEKQRRIAEHNATRNLQKLYDDDLRALRLGLDNGIDIEKELDATKKFIALFNYVTLVVDVNNPSSLSVGKPFTEIVIESATSYLLPVYPNNTINENARSKFRAILTSIYNAPITQGLLNSNPISSTINAAISQAGFFERQTSQTITSRGLRNGIELQTSNSVGPSFSDTQLNRFYLDIQGRVDFYNRLLTINNQSKEAVAELNAEYVVVSRSLRAGRTEICRLLGIPSDSNVTNEFHDKFEKRDITPQEITAFINDANFKRAISKSNYAARELPNVVLFKQKVLNAIVLNIDKSIALLEEYKSKATSAKLDASLLVDRIADFEKIRNDLIESPKKQ
jgi:hypothetical protein